ncbi:uncharacterized protein LOC133824533 [Humulus lupulus]|uniref:uncharacterized protein LOC133824533 n=1 Tax=Humulus lupulus TaxID=3486 RepID=UPI002B40A947|nr:uncharacterized protein LOC133824533 [Humulus lupulus]
MNTEAPPVSNRPGQPNTSNRFSALVTPSRPAHEDESSPYFLGTRDHPSLVLASPPLTDKNFQQWCRDFKILIGAKNKFSFLNGSLPQPAPDDPLLNPWLRCNQMLNNRFDQGNGPWIFELRESLISLHPGDNSVSAYFTQLKSMWDEIIELRPRTPCTCAASTDHLNFPDQEQVLQFLTGLNDSFHAVRAQILLIDPFPSFSKVFSMFDKNANHNRTAKGSKLQIAVWCGVGDFMNIPTS